MRSSSIGIVGDVLLGGVHFGELITFPGAGAPCPRCGGPRPHVE